MKKYLLILLSLSMILICCSCSKNKYGGDYDHLEFFTGKVIEIKDDNTVFIQITEERGGYKVDDKVYVHYEQALMKDKFYEFESSKGILDSNYKPVIGDEIYVQSFPEEEYKKINGYDYRESADPIIKYVTVDESSESSLKN